MEIYPGSKLRHFREIHRRTGIPYEQMVRLLSLLLLSFLLSLSSPSHSPFPSFPLLYALRPLVASSISGRDTNNQLFFDDEHRNFEVESLGITMCLVEPRGTDLKLFKEGLGMWRKRRGLKVEQE
jgi:magnesium-dependent phosphatase 1